MESNLVVPCHWDLKVLKELEIQNKKYSSSGIKISDMYGALAGEVIGNGRSPNKVKQLTRKDAIQFREEVKKVGLKFNYLLNNSIPLAQNPNETKVYEYLDWIINDFKPDALIIASKDMMKLIRKRYGNIPIHVSTIARVSSPEEIENFKDIHPTKIVLDNDLARDFDSLKKMVKYASEIGIGLELMATESCLRKCPYVWQHRDTISRGMDDTPLHLACNTKKFSNPDEILRANFIRPEDLEIYESLGLNLFKITGRSKPAHWLPEVTKAYLNRRYKGNLIRLLGIDPSLHAEDWVHLKNSALGGFIKQFPKTGLAADEKAYCVLWAKKLLKTEDFKIDGFKYDLSKSEITCIQGLSEFKRKYYSSVK